MPRPKETDHQMTTREAEYMRHILENGSMTVRGLLEVLPEPKPHVNTIGTTLKTLEAKGFLERLVNARPVTYVPTEKASRFADVSLARLVKNYFSNSYRRVVSALVEDEKISVDELKEIIDMIENKNNEK